MNFKPNRWLPAIIGVALLFVLFAFLQLNQFAPIKPEAEVWLSVNNQPYPLTQPISVTVPVGKPVEVNIRMFYQNQEILPGDFTYRWCFTPEVSQNAKCYVTGLRTNSNHDYFPAFGDSQRLEIFIENAKYQSVRVLVAFFVE